MDGTFSEPGKGISSGAEAVAMARIVVSRAVGSLSRWRLNASSASRRDSETSARGGSPVCVDKTLPYDWID